MAKKAQNFILISLSFILLLTYNSCDKNHDEADSYQPEVLNDGWPVSNAVDQGIDPQITAILFSKEAWQKLKQVMEIVGRLIEQLWF